MPSKAATIHRSSSSPTAAAAVPNQTLTHAHATFNRQQHCPHLYVSSSHHASTTTTTAASAAAYVFFVLVANNFFF